MFFCTDWLQGIATDAGGGFCGEDFREGILGMLRGWEDDEL